MNKLLLRLLMLPKGLWQSMGADTDQLRAILDVRLMLDDRRPVNFGRQRKQKKNGKFSILTGMVISLFLGAGYLLWLFAFEDRISSLWFYFTMFLFFLTFTLITDFSTILIDTRDKYIVLPRPISDRTLFLSRMLHIFIYLFRIVLPMSLPGWIAVGFLEGWKVVIWFPIPLLLLVFTAVFLVMLLYLLLLRMFTAAKFKEVLSYFQIAFSVFIFAVYYLGPRAMNMEAIRSFVPADHLWVRWFPSYWLGATWTWFSPKSGPAGTFLISLMAIIFPAVCIWITVRFLAPQFAAKLGGLDEVAPEEGGVATGKKVSGGKFYQRLATIFNKQPEAQAGFMMAWLQTARSRSFKMKVYPTFATVPVYFVYLLSTRVHGSVSEIAEHLHSTSFHLVLMYMCSFVFVGALTYMSISEQYKAAWIYYAAPMPTPGAVLAGAFKAMWIKFFLPFFLVIAIFVLSMWGTPAIIDVLLAMVNISLFAACIVRVSNRRFPFSILDQVNTRTSRFLKGLFSMIIPAALGFGHFVALHLVWLKVLFLVLSLILLWLVVDSYANTSWEVIDNEAE